MWFEIIILRDREKYSGQNILVQKVNINQHIVVTLAFVAW